MDILFEWNEQKRLVNLRRHGLDFRDAHVVFSGSTFTFEDDRFRYEEQRFVTLGRLNDVPVALVHTESEGTIRIISFRRATRNEEALFLLQTLQD